MADWSRWIELGTMMNEGRELTIAEQEEAIAECDRLCRHFDVLWTSLGQFEKDDGGPIEEFVPGNQRYDDFVLSCQLYCCEVDRMQNQTFSQIFDSRFPPFTGYVMADQGVTIETINVIIPNLLQAKAMGIDDPHGIHEMNEDPTMPLRVPNPEYQTEDPEAPGYYADPTIPNPEIVIVPWDKGERDVSVDGFLAEGRYEIDPDTNAAPWAERPEEEQE